MYHYCYFQLRGNNVACWALPDVKPQINHKQLCRSMQFRLACRDFFFRTLIYFNQWFKPAIFNQQVDPLSQSPFHDCAYPTCPTRWTPVLFGQTAPKRLSLNANTAQLTFPAHPLNQ